MRLVFAGTPPFAAHALKALHAAGHEVALVLTQPDRPSGRGMRPRASAVAVLAETLGLAVAKPASLKSIEERACVEAACPEVIVVAAYGIILPKSVLAVPRKACLNIHASLLPRWRGAAPIQRAILEGDSETGVTIMSMEPGLDTGPVLLERRVPILASDTAGSLTETLAAAGAESILEALEKLDDLVPKPQDSAAATYASKIDRSEAQLDWTRDARSLARQVRAFNPNPGSETAVGGQVLKIWEVELVEANGDPGTVVGVHQGAPVIACGRGGLALTVLQRPGARRMAAAEFLKGRPMEMGSRLFPLRPTAAETVERLAEPKSKARDSGPA